MPTIDTFGGHLKAALAASLAAAALALGPAEAAEPEVIELTQTPCQFPVARRDQSTLSGNKRFGRRQAVDRRVVCLNVVVLSGASPRFRDAVHRDGVGAQKFRCLVC